MIKNINMQKLKINIGIAVVIVLAITFVISFNHIISNPTSMFSKINEENYQKLTNIKFMQDFEDGIEAVARLKVSIANVNDPSELQIKIESLNYWQDFVLKNKKKYELLKGVQK
ncbi:hypothetical protein GCM10012288_07700 [Malaciobacter pacificus]|uniref:Uncharacterized protein n=1 Tax=Malaciobacter pacificus TaxID=1080223 RepID=A0A5C2HA07_9BACT|nr:hypothetical protein [Malaciobacter pacificus]QEP35179.1 hypothetical protein APAC_2107 [Malaciobacter pacificus]GGD36172.1 hypothetical protein GCM10012288_07700 [Malaciobacter pacificus]